MASKLLPQFSSAEFHYENVLECGCSRLQSNFSRASTGSNIEPGVLPLCCNEKNWGKYFFLHSSKKPRTLEEIGEQVDEKTIREPD